MHVCVVGAGVVGLTTAYMLVRKGHDVTLIDRAHSVGLGTSYANGAQLSYSYVAPLASRELLAKLPFLLLSPSSPMKLRVRQDRSVVSWALAFLRECNDRSVSVSTTALLALAAHSKEMLEMVAGECKLKFGFREAGKLVLYRSERSFVSARKQAELQASIVGDNDQQVVLSSPEVFTRQPNRLEIVTLFAMHFSGSFKQTLALRRNWACRCVLPPYMTTPLRRSTLHREISLPMRTSSQMERLRLRSRDKLILMSKFTRLRGTALPRGALLIQFR
jgi:hypothetical protein